MMRFTHAHILFWLWALVPAAAVMVYGIRRRKRIVDRFVGPELQGRVVPGFSSGPAWIKAVLVLLGLGLCIFSLAGPQAGFKWEKTRQRGVDLMIALDCSRSMLAADVSPNRLERAKREIIDLTRLMRSDRAGLVAFSGRAVLQCPLTMDYEAFQIFLNVLGPDYLPVGGTDLAAALETCFKGFDAAADTEKAIIVITDGEDTAERGREALDTVVQTLAKERIRVFAIGVGDPAGAPVPDERGGFKRDRAGAIVMSRVDEAGLKRIAAATGGRYIRSVSGDMDLEELYGQEILKTMARSTFVQGKKKVWENRFQWALLPGIVLLLAELFVGGRAKKSLGRTAGCAALCLCLAGVASPARAGIFTSPVTQGMAAYEKGDFHKAKKLFIDAQLENPDDPRLYYNIGAAAYAAGEYDLARDNFSQALASKDKALRQNALFNLANTRYRMGDLSGAVADYESLLKEFPKDTQARENLEFVKKKQEEQRREKSREAENPSDNPKKKPGEDQDHKDQGSRGKQAPDQAEKNSTGQNQAGQNQRGDLGGQKGDSQQGGEDQGSGQGPAGTAPEDKAGKPGGSHKEIARPTGTNDQDSAGGQARGKGQVGKPGDPGQEGRAGQPMSDEAARMLENRLNRLSDTPGRALIPAGGAQTIERDW